MTMTTTYTPNNVLPDGRIIVPGVHWLYRGRLVVNISGQGGTLIDLDALVRDLGLSSGSDPIAVSGWYGDIYYLRLDGRCRIAAVRIRDKDGYGLAHDLKEAYSAAMTLGLQPEVERLSRISDRRIFSQIHATCGADETLTEEDMRKVLKACREAMADELRSIIGRG